MNIIDAWKAARTGQKLIRWGFAINWVIKTNSSDKFKDYLVVLGPDSILADDWSVEKEKRHIEITWEEFRHAPPLSIPDNAKISIDWEE